MKRNATFTAEGRLNSKAKRIQELKKQFKVHPPNSSYVGNSTKEELCLEYVKNFINQFQSVYPQRKVPYMIAENECGVKKFVCSTLRPSQPQFSELYDMHECAVFLAGYMLYEPLEPPTEPPTILPSPHQSLEWHVGDSFDLAILLCSLLLGNGYDAYVVYGYAPKYITLHDQTKTQCPLISKIVREKTVGKGSSGAGESANDEGPETNADNVYVPPNNEVRESVYLQQQREKKRLEGIDSFVLWCSDVDDSPNPAEGSADNIPRRCHAWVLVRAGMMDVQEHTFLEPSTGRAYSTTNSPYTAIEGLWNRANYWMNASLATAPAEMSFSLSDSSQWEYLFLSSPSRREGAGSPGKSLRHSASVPDDLLHGHEGDSSDKKESDTLERHLDPPPSWVCEILIDRPKYLLRYPPLGRRTTQYFKAKVDYFAKNQHPQAMVMRVVLYLDSTRITVKEIHEWFENRRDKMYKRVRYLLEGRFVEEFFPGSVGEVRRWEEHPGKKRDIDFYVSGRLDRMCRREEVIGERISEFFQGRTDFLTYRSILLTLNREKVGSKTSYSLPSGGLSGDLYVLRINQSFDHDPAALSGSDIAHRTFHLPEGRVVTQHHFVDGKITQKVKVHSHAKSNAGVLTGGEELSPEDLEGIQEAALIERECFAAVKLSYVQIMNVIKIRSEFEGNVAIEKTVFENALERAEKGVTGAVGVEEDHGTDAKGIDYLTPYLRNIKDIKLITKEEALEVRQACLDALKARLVERANIIQSRLNEETAKLARKQEQFQRSQREGDLSTEEYEKYCTEAMFRIQILEQRLVAHEESAIQKFGKLDSRLSTEPRLAVLLKKD